MQFGASAAGADPGRRRLLLAGLLLPCLSASAVSATAPGLSRAAAFLLGDRLSLAGLLEAQNKSAEAGAPLTKAKSFAAGLGVTIAPFPAHPAGAKADDPKVMADMIHYLVSGEGWAIAAELEKRFDRSHALLYEVAVKSNLLLVLYQPGDDAGIAGVIRNRCSVLALPPALWSGLVAAIEARKPLPEVHKALFDMHRNVPAYYVTGR